MMMGSDLINVGVADIKLASSSQVIRTILGSCIGICIYDRQKKMGGMAHILLPEQTKNDKPEKYANTAIPLLIDLLLKQGCSREFMSAKIAGGASMFQFKSHSPLSKIGDRNIESSEKILEIKKIPLLAKDVGGSTGRVIDFFMNDGHLKVKANGQEVNYYKV